MKALLSSPHASRNLSIRRIMGDVILACLPGLVILTWYFGWGIVINVLWLSVAALAVEALMLACRGRDIALYLGDCSALVTALLLGLALPPGLPWWMGLIGISFALVVAKHLYGGIGYNPFNPAMAGYVALLISFPVEMTTWNLPRGVVDAPPGFFDSLFIIFSFADTVPNTDAFTGATMLDSFKLDRGGLQTAEFFRQNPLAGYWSGIGWEQSNLAFLAGGIYLLYRRVITWHIPVSLLGALFLMAALFHDAGSSASTGSPLLHLFGGATMLGAFFIATDPVSAATTNRGRLIYGALIGILLFVIRAWGNYPDALAFAVLLGNFAAPLIDYYARTQPFGRKS